MVESIHSNTDQAAIKKQLINIAANAGVPASQRETAIRTEAPRMDSPQKIQEGQKGQDLRKQLHELSAELNKEMKRINTDITFNYNDEIRGLVVTVKEDGGNKIIREIPSKEAIELMSKMRDIITGLIFDKKG
ncbi:FlaG family protein [Helicobacter mustelae]|uniref:Possible flagellar protein n=1 Tax=Helicobacter mustelae (strain ATCC 43772 / CCUG 25715 / CIP 103759 / LMG 18044 / NCTC 12198 / R85-136P) TaxID=679897 RepID=D3UGM6_HELM1|nr:FlaG family protein [Helicobacter mustelae]CBG39647.1 possible flagellar protein [Helicobacter mustelae 12198]SQH71158.1 flagellar protein [Helicobacter mustelae]STP12286.1 flagellar protein [Helicobacter mustelae]